jgi:MATE family multidrug resistance protein
LPIWAELHGAQRGADSGARCGRRCTSSSLASLAGVLGLLFPNALPAGHGSAARRLQDDVRQYLSVLALALPAALMFRLYSTLNQSLGQPPAGHAGCSSPRWR